MLDFCCHTMVNKRFNKLRKIKALSSGQKRSIPLPVGFSPRPSAFSAEKEKSGDPFQGERISASRFCLWPREKRAPLSVLRPDKCAPGFEGRYGYGYGYGYETRR